MADKKEEKKRTPGKKRKRRRRLKAALLAVEVLMVFVLALGFYAVGIWDEMDYVKVNRDDIFVNEDLDEEYVESIRTGYTNIAVLGVDGEGYNCDVILICSINEDTGEIKMVSVYRDTLLLMQDGSYKKINSAIIDSDLRRNGTNMLNTLNQNLDLNLEDYALINWTAVALAVDALGGVTVDVTDAMFTEINGYITDTANHLDTEIPATQLAGPGTQTLTGVQTVAYCRLRHQDSDIGRTSRQREVIVQLFQKAKTADFSTLMDVVDLVLPYVTTTLDINDVISLVSNLGKYYMGDMTGWPFYQQSIANYRYNGYWPMFALNLQNNVSQLHEFLFGSTGYVPSVTVQTISQVLEAECGLPTPETTPFSSE